MKVETINIGPTWMWVAHCYFAFVANKENPKVIAGFREELHRLGPTAVAMLRKFHSKRGDNETRAFAKSEILRLCREADARSEKK